MDNTPQSKEFRNLPGTDTPRGCIPLVEKQEAHEQFLDAADAVDTVLIKLNHVKRLVDQGETAGSYFGSDVQVISSSAMHDRWLQTLEWEYEKELVEEFKPDFHIPTDHPVYWKYTPGQRLRNTRKSMEGFMWMSQELEAEKTTLLPVLKGLTPEEREICYKVFAKLEVEYCCFYGTQYFTSGKGFGELSNDINRIVSEAPKLNIFLIGVLHPPEIFQLPPQVVASSGLHQWRKAVELRDVSWEKSGEMFQEFKAKTEEAFESGQTPLGMWQEDTLMEGIVYG